MSLKIIAIGGGEINYNGSSQTIAIDEEIISLSNKKTPLVLFVPTASNDSDSYFNSFKSYYEEKFNCNVQVLKLIESNISEKEIEEKISLCDIIYVGGGDTEKLMNVLKEKNIRKIINRYANKLVLSGISAGGICWFNEGYSKDKNMFMRGLNLTNISFFPHYNKNDDLLIKKIVENKKIIACENKTALVVLGDQFKIINSDNFSFAYLFYLENNTIKKEKLIINKFYPLSVLNS